jgi:hypothetical protein
MEFRWRCLASASLSAARHIPFRERASQNYIDSPDLCLALSDDVQEWVGAGREKQPYLGSIASSVGQKEWFVAWVSSKRGRQYLP